MLNKILNSLGQDAATLYCIFLFKFLYYSCSQKSLNYLHTILFIFWLYFLYLPLIFRQLYLDALHCNVSTADSHVADYAFVPIPVGTTIMIFNFARRSKMDPPLLGPYIILPVLMLFILSRSLRH